MKTRTKVFLGMSGGVDSSLSAVLLQEQGYEVVGVYMKNWSRDLPGMSCPWADDLADAKRIAVKLGIDFRVFDFETEYKQKVVDYMLAEFRAGRTPNPDIMCNQEIKFKLFHGVAREQGADFIATGHYARVLQGGEYVFSGGVSRAAYEPRETSEPRDVRPLGRELPKANGSERGCRRKIHRTALARAVDENKDQTYFLYRISQEALSHTLFPIGHLLKPEVKKLAAKYGLHNAYKKESMGVCFVGEVGIRDFLREYIDIQPGPILDADTGKRLGTHEGAMFYTVGQRHGLHIDKGLPYYLVRKDAENNILYVSKNLNHQDLWTQELELEDIIIRGVALPGPSVHNMSDKESCPEKSLKDEGLAQPHQFFVRLRHRAPLIPARLFGDKLIFEQEIKRPASGQSAVFYHDQICLGGGIIK